VKNLPKKGKCFSGVNRGQRKKSDGYFTPYSITQQLLDVEDFDGSILEPAAGKGAIVNVLSGPSGIPDADIEAYDVERDFLKETRQFDCIITNPPFSLAQEFILQAKKVAKKKIAMLLPLSYLHGEKRYREIYSDQKCFPLKCVYVFTRYPMLGDKLREDGRYRTGCIVFGWYIWEKKNKINEPAIRWIDNNKYIIRKNGNQK
jgi:hypothetical protein